VIGELLWKGRFNASPETIGRVLFVNAMPFTIVGVAPASFRGTDKSTTSLTSTFRLPINVNSFRTGAIPPIRTIGGFSSWDGSRLVRSRTRACTN
jgi:hypothetical protein